MRQESLVANEVYHVYTRSIAEYVIFNKDFDYERMRQLMLYYSTDNDTKYSKFIIKDIVTKNGFYTACKLVGENSEPLVQIIAYCIMPTHIHLVLKQLKDNGISTYMRKVLDGYTRYFNLQHKRKGPLWESRFKIVLVSTDEQLRHLTRYFHLNPVTAGLTKKPEDWKHSSYREYLCQADDSLIICRYNDLLDIAPDTYKQFVEDQISYQKQLGLIKKILLES